MMKKKSLALIILAVWFSILFFGLNKEISASDDVSLSDGGAETAVRRLPEKRVYELLKENKVTRTYEAYPRELYFGDTLYIAGYVEVISDEPVMMEKIYFEDDPFGPDKLRISSDELNETYERYLMNPEIRKINGGGGCMVSTFRLYQPGERACCDAYYPEICPLGEYELSFWKELRTKMSQEGILCHVSYYKNQFITKDALPVFAFDIRIKPRPANEMELLRTWYESTPEELFSLQWDQQSGGRNKIRLSNFSLKGYEPGLFIRTGFRKPWIPNNPRTLDGWRKLEASIVPSTMRDEITMIRFNLELFAAKGNAARKRVRNEYVEWLNSLPEVQRTVMLLKYEYRYPGNAPSGRAWLSVDRNALGASDFMVPIEE